jgi:hypothetical protein
MRPRDVRNWLPLRVESVTSSERQTGGPYDYLARGARPAAARKLIGAHAGKRPEATELRIATGCPLQVPVAQALRFAANTMAPGVLSSNVAVNDLRTRRRHGVRATGRVVKVGRTQIVTAGEVHPADSERSKLVAAATAIVPAG